MLRADDFRNSRNTSQLSTSSRAHTIRPYGESVPSVPNPPDRWALTLLCLAGEPLPELPATPGRVIRAPEIETPEADAARIEAEQQAAAIWRALAEGEGSGDHD